jgi:hypothetical protein
MVAGIISLIMIFVAPFLNYTILSALLKWAGVQADIVDMIPKCRCAVEKILEMLGAKDEEEAISKIRLLAVPPVGVTIVGTADGSISLATTGNPTVELVEHLLLEGLKVCAFEKMKGAPNACPPKKKEKAP